MKTQCTYEVFFVVQEVGKKDWYNRKKVKREVEMTDKTVDNDLEEIRMELQSNYTGQISITGIAGPYGFKVVDEQTPA